MAYAATMGTQPARGGEQLLVRCFALPLMYAAYKNTVAALTRRCGLVPARPFPAARLRASVDALAPAVAPPALGQRRRQPQS